MAGQTSWIVNDLASVPRWPQWVKRYRNGLFMRLPLSPRKRSSSGHPGLPASCTSSPCWRSRQSQSART